MGVSSQPLQPAAATAATASTVLLKNAPLETMLLRRTIRSPEPPSGAYVNHFNSSGAAGFAQRLDPAGSKSPRMTNKAGNQTLWLGFLTKSQLKLIKYSDLFYFIFFAKFSSEKSSLPGRWNRQFAYERLRRIGWIDWLLVGFPFARVESIRWDGWHRQFDIVTHQLFGCDGSSISRGQTGSKNNQRNG